MNSEHDMDTPVTRRELHEELVEQREITRRELHEELVEQREITRRELREELGLRFAEEREITRGELREQLLEHREEVREELTQQRGEWREELAKFRGEWREEFAKHREEVREELATQRGWLAQYADDILSRHSKAMMEYLQSLIGPVDDKYSSLPKRTDELETTVADLSPRVSTLGRKVFAPPKRRPAKRASRRR